MRTFTLNNYIYFHREFGCDQNAKENFSIVSGQNVIDLFLNLPPRKRLEIIVYTPNSKMASNELFFCLHVN